MGFKSNMPYAMNAQLQQQVDDKQARDKAAFAPGGMNDGTPWYQRESYLRATGQEIPEKPIEKVEWANGLGNNIDGSYSNSYTPNQGPNPSGSFSFQQNQDRQDLLTYGPNGKPNITNNNMNNTQDPSLIDPANVGESGQLNTFSDTTRQVAGQTYGGQLEKTAAMSPLAMTIDPSAAYNAMDALKAVQNLNLSQSVKSNYRRDTDNVSKSLGLPSLPTSSTGSGTMSGSYSNPTSINSEATINTPPPASSTPQYSFLENNNIAQPFDMSKLSNPEHRSGFMGFYKRNAPSIKARIDDAKAEGKTRKVTRLEKKLQNFTDYQAGGKGFVGRAFDNIGSIFKKP
jgi:hypothetical protein